MRTAVRSAIPLACLASGAPGQCVESAFRLPFTIGPREVHALAGFDDGTGPALYQGGETYLGGRPALVRWDGSAWLPAGIGPGPEVVWALRVLEEPGGPGMYVGGSFTSAGGVPALNLARRDAQGWSTLGGGVPEVVRCIHRHDFDGPGPQPPALLVGTSAGVRRWDGAQWVLLAATAPANYPGVLAMASFDDDGAGPGIPELYAGGRVHRDRRAHGGVAGALRRRVVASARRGPLLRRHRELAGGVSRAGRRGVAGGGGALG